MVKRLEFSLKATTSASQIKFFSCWSNLIQSRLHVMENALFLRFFRSVDHLFDNPESRKRNYYFGKTVEKSGILDKESVRTLIQAYPLSN